MAYKLGKEKALEDFAEGVNILISLSVFFVSQIVVIYITGYTFTTIPSINFSSPIYGWSMLVASTVVGGTFGMMIYHLLENKTPKIVKGIFGI